MKRENGNKSKAEDLYNKAAEYYHNAIYEARTDDYRAVCYYWAGNAHKKVASLKQDQEDNESYWDEYDNAGADYAKAHELDATSAEYKKAYEQYEEDKAEL